jgi:hypothetical protein
LRLYGLQHTCGSFDANGYTAGGVSVGTVGSQTSGISKFIGGTDPAGLPQVVRSGRSVRSAIQFHVRTKPLIGWWDYGTAVTLTNGNTFTVDIDQSTARRYLTWQHFSTVVSSIQRRAAPRVDPASARLSKPRFANVVNGRLVVPGADLSQWELGEAQYRDGAWRTMVLFNSSGTTIRSTSRRLRVRLSHSGDLISIEGPTASRRRSERRRRNIGAPLKVYFA